jgi:peptide/nickel transport system permease protein
VAAGAEPLAAAAGPARLRVRTRWSAFRPRLSGSALIAATLLTVLVLASIGLPLLPITDPYTQNLADRTQAPLSVSRTGQLHVLGTDALGRDLLSRLAVAGRTSLVLALSAVLVSLAIGTLLGLLAGYAGGTTDNLLMGLADIQLSIPRILLVIAVVAVVGPSLTNLALVLGVTSWVGYARLIRAQTLALREREFVLAARGLGAAPGWLMLRHILPNAFPPALILASFEIGQMVTLEASLSFLGLGIQPPLPAWGSMINEGQPFLRSFPWLMILPGVAIFIVVAGVNFLTQSFTGERRASNFQQGSA